jgi:hypothetical protein
MKKTIIALAVAYMATLTGLRADTSYLLIQGPFGAGGGTDTFEWQVNYQAGALLTGQALLNSIFGQPALNGTYSDGFGGTYNYYAAGNGTQGAGYIDFGSNPGQLTEPFLTSVTLNSTTVAQDPSYSPGWNYYVAGGGPDNGAGYSDGAWTYSNDGEMGRTLANGSFDAWVFGATYPAATIDDGTVGGINDDGSASTGVNAPTVADFAGATVIEVVPEPGSAALLIVGAAGLFKLYPRRRA